MKLLIKAYAIPLLVLVLGIFLYFSMIVFYESKDDKFAKQDSKKEIKEIVEVAQNTKTDDIEQNISIDKEQQNETKADQLAQNDISQNIETNIEPSTQPQVDPSATPQQIDQPIEQPQVELKKYVVIADSINVRSSTDNGEIIGKKHLHDVVMVEEVKNGWAKLEDGSFIASRLLIDEATFYKNKVEESSDEQSQGLPYYVGVKVLNIRSQPESNAQIVGVVKLNQKVFVKSIKNNWAELESGGFVSFSLLKPNL